jgi:hypothetical protein
MKCIHGFEDHSWCGYCKPKKKATAAKVKSKVTKSSKPELVKTSKICISCQKYAAAKGARGKCIFCAKKKGYKVCIKCIKMFIPKPPHAKHCGCKSKGKGSVWIVASAGLPSLGRKR